MIRILCVHFLKLKLILLSLINPKFKLPISNSWFRMTLNTLEPSNSSDIRWQNSISRAFRLLIFILISMHIFHFSIIISKADFKLILTFFLLFLWLFDYFLLLLRNNLFLHEYYSIIFLSLIPLFITKISSR